MAIRNRSEGDRGIAWPSRCIVLILLALSCMSLAPDVSADMLNGPYLVYPGQNTQMTVVWRLTDSPTCQLAWGTTTAYNSGSVNISPDGSRRYTYTITQLTPGMKYYYRVTENGNQHFGSFFNTPDDKAQRVGFYALGDTRDGPSRMNSVFGQILAQIDADPLSQTFLLHSGDWNGSCGSSEWNSQFFSRYENTMEAQSKLAIMGTDGNHDCTADLRAYFPWPYAAANRTYYSFDYGPVHVINLDQSASYGPGTNQYNWLVDDLKATDKVWKIILLHSPGYSDGNHSNDTSVQDYIQPLCVQYDVQLVVAGHNHYYARCMTDDVYHLTLGGGGAPLYNPDGSCEESEETLHFAKFNVDPAGSQSVMSVEIIRPDGSFVELFDIVRTVAPPDPGDTVPPTAPAGLSAVSATATQVHLEWGAATDNVGVTAYRVYNNGVQAATVTATAATVSGLLPQTSYQFTVTAVDAAGNESAPSNTETIVTDQFSIAADFTVDVVSIQTDQSVTFTGTASQSPVSWAWSFPGGVPDTSTANDPVITYHDQGTYDVTLTVTFNGSSQTVTKQGLIVVSASNPSGSGNNGSESGASGGGGGGCFVGQVLLHAHY